MALGSSDERDLLLPLYGGIDEDPLWQTFLRRLLARTGARQICLLLQPAGEPPSQRIVSAPGYESAIAFDIEELSESGLLPYAALRPHRVYSLQEMFALDNADTAKRQRAVLGKASIAHARFIRIVSPGDDNAWLVILHDRHDFRAAESALLSALAPHLGLALGMLADAGKLRLRLAMAETALSLIGVGQAAFDAEGRVVAADAIAGEELDVQPSGRPQLRPRAAQALAAACEALAGAAAPTRQVVRIDERTAKDMLLRPAPPVPGGLPNAAAAVGLVRRAHRENAASAARIIAAAHGLSVREAALAAAISRGRTIIDAGAELQLTRETARNYSKRIYAKTGVSGQADLVRLLLTGLAPFS